jgi:hypothetical protein
MNLENFIKWPGGKVLVGAIIIVVGTFTLAKWWNPFGPSTYEDCILQGTHGVSSDAGVELIRSACVAKFKKSRLAILPMAVTSQQDDAALLKKCKVSDSADSRSVFSIFKRPSLLVAANKLKRRSVSHDYYQSELSFQNGNGFAISAVAIGFTKQNSCPVKADSYDAVFVCGGYVGAGTYGSLQCPPKISEFKGSYCVTAIQPGDLRLAYSPLDIAKKLDSLKLCE